VISTDVRSDSSIVCKPLGNLDWSDAMSLRQVVRGPLQPGAEIVIDLSGVEFIDAVGMQAVVGSVRLARAFGSTARICNARPQVQRVMDLVGVDRLLMRSSNAVANDAA
jgi:anti-sigma B factor antagonist